MAAPLFVCTEEEQRAVIRGLKVYQELKPSRLSAQYGAVLYQSEVHTNGSRNSYTIRQA
jgi:hypothetical protein